MSWLNVRNSARRVLFLATTLAALAAGGGNAGAADAPTLLIGAGRVSGVYYPVAGAICDIVNKARSDISTCAVVPGDSSKANLEALRSGRIDFAVVQSDWQFWAYRGADFFADSSAFIGLNAVLSLYAEPLVIAVRSDSDITDLDGLKGKRIGVGAPGTAERGMMEALRGALGWSMSDFAEVRESPTKEQTAALCKGDIDAGVYAVGSPSALLAHVTAQCPIALLPIEGPAVEKLLHDVPYYRAAKVPAGIYPGIDQAVPTFGVGATLVTRADVPEDTVAALVGAVMDNLAAFRALHPALTWLDGNAMSTAGLSAPLHPGAARAFAARKGS